MFENTHHVVILGGGFGGLYAAKSLGNKPGIRVTLFDKQNFHLFQPLLYQVATGSLSPGDIAIPLRDILKAYKNVQVFMGEVIDILPDDNRVILRDGSTRYDTLVVAVGGEQSYFGHNEWACKAPGLKEISDALEMRRRILLAFEAAERESDLERRKDWLTFVIIGGGPTGVELAGALADFAHHSIIHDFRNIHPQDAQIWLLEGSDRILSTYPTDLSEKAAHYLCESGVTVETQALVTDIQDRQITYKYHDEIRRINAHTILWGAGVKASRLSSQMAKHTPLELDKGGRIKVEADFTLKGHPDIFVIGDLASYIQPKNNQPLPGLAPAAMQAGSYVADIIKHRIAKRPIPAFVYRDKGMLSIVGRNSAVALIGGLHLDGFPAWILWAFVHIFYLIEFENQVLVFFKWLWNRLTDRQSSRLITGKDPYPLFGEDLMKIHPVK